MNKLSENIELQYKEYIKNNNININNINFKHGIKHINVYDNNTKLFKIHFHKFSETDIYNKTEKWNTYIQMQLQQNKSKELLEKAFNKTYPRPVKFGVSTGNGTDLLRNEDCCSTGTLGFLVYDTKNKKHYVVSNAHVFVNHDSTIINDASSSIINDLIIQSGAVDFNVPCHPSFVEPNKIALLKKWIALSPNITINPITSVDVAIAEPLPNKVNLTGEILLIGIPKSVNANNALQPQIKMNVQKSGRTTSKTNGNISIINATINVKYSSCYNIPDFYIKFSGLFGIISSSFSKAGDSGSLVLERRNNNLPPQPLGLLFAGNSFVTFCFPIHRTLAQIDTLLNVPHGTTILVGNKNLTKTITNLDKNILKVQQIQKIQEKYNNEIFNNPNIVASGITYENNKYFITLLQYSINKNLFTQKSFDNIPIKIINLTEPIIAL